LGRIVAICTAQRVERNKCQPNLRQLTTWHCPHFPAAAAARLLLTAARAAIDRYLLPAGPAAANPSQRHEAAGQDRQTDMIYPTVT